MTPERLEAIFREAPGSLEGPVKGLHRLAGGASRQIWGFRGRGPDGEAVDAVLRLGSDATSAAAVGHETEVALLRAAAARGVPVPRVLGAGRDDEIGPFILMTRVSGETIGRRILREPSLDAARRRLVRDLAVAAARIHRIPASDVPGLPGADPGGELARYRDIYDSAALEPHPAIELGLDWLEERRTVGMEGATVVHGDFRLGNVIVDETGLRAVLDWELAHRGDPVEDLGWLCVRSWRFGANDLPAAGVGTREELLEAYSEESGAEVPMERLRYWELFGNVKWAVINTLQARSAVDGGLPLELASLGRRTAETELEILDLVEAWS